MTDVQRSGWIGRHELDAGHASTARIAAAVGGAGCEYRAHFALVRGGAQEEIDEAGTGDLDLRDCGVRRQHGNQCGREIAWLLAADFREQQCGVRRKVAVFTAFCAFDDEYRRIAGRQRAVGAERGDRIENKVAQLVFQGI